MPTVISIEHLSKAYRLGQIGTGTLSHDLNVWWARVRGKPNPLLRIGETDHGNRDGETLWALKDVSFKVQQGEVLGIIGRNGAGKSTLLKILSRVTAPTSGKIKVKGRVASLLEVGTGFHPELTGRENIYLNGAILGMSRKEIDRKFNEIVDFAEVEKFIDTPVKRYSSGMYVRLAFAVAAHLDTEILVVDEVLAVGDIEFQKKCLGKMGDVAKSGRTVLFVSHNMIAIRAQCNQTMVLDHGQIQCIGETSESIDYYINIAKANSLMTWRRSNNDSQCSFCFQEIRAELVGTQPQLILRCYLTLVASDLSPRAFVAVDIVDRSLTPIMQAIPEAQPFTTGATGIHKIQVDVELPPLVPGFYVADFWVGSHYTHTLDLIRQAITFEVTTTPTPNRTFPHTSDHGFVVPIAHFKYHAPD
jgi:lipopolysaccharide transport system ATP-binding protein